MELNDLKLNQKALITEIKASNNIIKRLMDIGFVRGSIITPVLINRGNSIVAYDIKGTTIAVRKKDTKGIGVKKIWRSV